MKLVFKNKEHTNKYDDGEGNKFNGTFKLKKDAKKARVLKKYKNYKLVIFENQSTQTTEEDNYLPKSR